jgi:hypothetical protein
LNRTFSNWPTIQLSEPLSLQKSFQELLRKQNGDRALWEYPFAVAGVNITFMLIQMLDLQAGSLQTFQHLLVDLNCETSLAITINSVNYFD